MALIKCNECGKEVSDTIEKCIHCGSILKRIKTCLECNTDYDVGLSNCPNCGWKEEAGKKEVMPTLQNIMVSKKKMVIIGIVILIILFVFVFPNGKSKNGISITKVYETIGCEGYYCTKAGDDSYLEIDTNPLNIEDYSSSIATALIKEANLEFGFTETLYKKMGTTRALDGVLADENDNVRVTWRYHPDNGLNVIYAKK